jgi:carboxypeptidase Taq
MWENMVGRSRPFWIRRYADLQHRFPEALGNVTLDAFHAAINEVTPSCIRVEADEVTYNLHIILRFEMERALIDGSLAVEDIPGVWNEKMKALVGIEPSNDREGCLQDIHWTLGTFGYFPTYTLGNLYAAQFFEAAKVDIGNLEARIRDGDLGALLSWLRTNIHEQGQRYRAEELCEKVTGTPLAIEPFTNYLAVKFSEIYKL